MGDGSADRRGVCAECRSCVRVVLAFFARMVAGRGCGLARVRLLLALGPTAADGPAAAAPGWPPPLRLPRLRLQRGGGCGGKIEHQQSAAARVGGRQKRGKGKRRPNASLLGCAARRHQKLGPLSVFGAAVLPAKARRRQPMRKISARLDFRKKKMLVAVE